MAFVTHSIEEAVQLSGRVCVITPRPGRIDRVIEIDLPYPRDLEVKKSRRFVDYVGEIQGIFHGWEKYRERCREMMIRTGVPGVRSA